MVQNRLLFLNERAGRRWCRIEVEKMNCVRRVYTPEGFILNKSSTIPYVLAVTQLSGEVLYFLREC